MESDMDYYFYTPAQAYETLEQFKKHSDWDYTLYLSPRDGCFSAEDMGKAFKGFDFNQYYLDSHIDAFALSGFFSHKLLEFTHPVFDMKEKTVSYFESLDKRTKKIRTSSKIGKFFRKIGPYYNDKQIEMLVNLTLDMFQEKEYTYHVTTSREGFKEIYTSPVEKGRNLGNYSCINASCMRHEFGRIHPSEIYGTGDFELHYLLNEDGEVAARTVLCTLDQVYTSVYVSNTSAGDKLVEKIKEKYEDAHYDEDAYRPWNGAKLWKLESPDDPGYYIAAYMDCASDVREEGEYFVVAYRNADYCLCSASGMVEKRFVCENCGCDSSSDNQVFTDTGDSACTNCADWCDFTSEWTISGVTDVYYGSRVYAYSNCSVEALEEYAVFDEVTDKWYTKKYFVTLMDKRAEENEEEEVAD